MTTTVHIGFEKDLRFTLEYLGKSLVLRHAPVNWDEAFLRWERSEKYHGLFRSYSQSLVFPKDGAYFLRKVFYRTKGRTRAECTLKIEKLDRTSLEFEEVFYGDFDFSTFVDQRDTVTVTVTETGLVKYLKLYEDTEYDVYLSDTFNYTEPLGGTYTCYYSSYYDILYALLEKMTGNRISSGEYLIDLGFITTSAETRGMTNGRAIRTPDDWTGTYRLRTTFAKVMGDIIKQNYVGATIVKVGGKDCLKIVSIDTIYDSATEIYDFGEVRELKLQVDEKRLFNKIEVGYDDPTYQTISGINEFCCKSIFKTPQEMSTGTFDLMSEYRADWTGIRDAILMDAANDGGLDEDIFHVYLYLNGATYEPYIGGVTKSGSGVWSEAYNVPLSPARCLIRWKKYVNGCHDGFAGTGQYVTLEASGLDNVYNVTTDLMIPIPDEVYEDYTYSILNTKLFLPYLFKFQAPAGYEFLQALQANPLGYVSFSFREMDFTGFLQSGSVTLAANGIIDFTLLACPGNDLTKLIRV
jgi:hypothetical protein